MNKYTYKIRKKYGLLHPKTDIMTTPPPTTTTQTAHKIVVPNFSSTSNGGIVMDLLIQIEFALEYINSSTQKSFLGLFRSRQNKGALALWYGLQSSKVCNGLPRIITWLEMKTELLGRYSPLNYQQELSWKILSLAQNPSIVTAYNDHFHTLHGRVNMVEPEALTIVRYINGLQ